MPLHFIYFFFTKPWIHRRFYFTSLRKIDDIFQILAGPFNPHWYATRTLAYKRAIDPFFIFLVFSVLSHVSVVNRFFLYSYARLRTKFSKYILIVCKNESSASALPRKMLNIDWSITWHSLDIEGNLSVKEFQYKIRWYQIEIDNICLDEESKKMRCSYCYVRVRISV